MCLSPILYSKQEEKQQLYVAYKHFYYYRFLSWPEEHNANEAVNSCKCAFVFIAYMDFIDAHVEKQMVFKKK